MHQLCICTIFESETRPIKFHIKAYFFQFFIPKNFRTFLLSILRARLLQTTETLLSAIAKAAHAGLNRQCSLTVVILPLIISLFRAADDRVEHAGGDRYQANVVDGRPAEVHLDAAEDAAAETD
jgi:hypothetical protein